MKKLPINWTKGLLFLISLILSYTVVTMVIAEQFFFDKLYYNKSSRFGYEDDYLGVIKGRKRNKIVFSRLGDLISLINIAQNKLFPDKILGTKDPDLYNIAVIGDSFVYGTGVRENETFPKILENKLSKIQDVKVYNFGLPGSNVINNYSIFLLAEEYLDIDLYIIGVVEDDLLYFGLNKRYPEEEQIHDDFISRCPNIEFRYSPEKGKDWSQVIIEGIYPSFSDNYANICVLSDIVLRLALKNTIFINLNTTKIPSEVSHLNTSSEKARKKALSIYKYAEVIRRSGGIIIDPFDNPHFQYTQVSTREGHASKETHKLQAEFLYEAIMGNPSFEFPQ